MINSVTTLHQIDALRKRGEGGKQLEQKYQIIIDYQSVNSGPILLLKVIEAKNASMLLRYHNKGYDVPNYLQHKTHSSINKIVRRVSQQEKFLSFLPQHLDELKHLTLKIKHMGTDMKFQVETTL